MPTRIISVGICHIKTMSLYEKMFLIMSWTHGNLVSKLRRSGGRERERRMLPHVWMGTLYVCSQANTGSLFWNRLITSDSNLFRFRKYTNHLQVLFASVFTKLSWQAQTFWVYIKQENEWVWISVSVCARAATRVVEGGAGVGLTKLLVETQGLGQGAPLMKQGHSHLHTKWPQRQQWCWRPCLWAIMGPNQRQTAYWEETPSQLPSSLNSSSAFLKAV